MSKPNFSKRTFELLSELRANNNKTWFDAHRDELDAHGIAPFVAMLESVTSALSTNRIPLIGGKKTVFRMNRDVRFSQDKRPYKDNISGLLTPNGQKTGSPCLVYIHLGIDEAFIAAGFYQLPTPALNSLREKILTNEKAFASIQAALCKDGLEWMRDESLKKMPRGFEDFTNHRFADVLRLKSLVVKRDLPRSVWTKGDPAKDVISFARAATPLLAFGLAD